MWCLETGFQNRRWRNQCVLLSFRHRPDDVISSLFFGSWWKRDRFLKFAFNVQNVCTSQHHFSFTQVLSLGPGLVLLLVSEWVSEWVSLTRLKSQAVSFSLCVWMEVQQTFLGQLRQILLHTKTRLEKGVTAGHRHNFPFTPFFTHGGPLGPVSGSPRFLNAVLHYRRHTWPCPTWWGYPELQSLCSFFHHHLLSTNQLQDESAPYNN